VGAEAHPTLHFVPDGTVADSSGFPRHSAKARFFLAGAWGKKIPAAAAAAFAGMTGDRLSALIADITLRFGAIAEAVGAAFKDGG
jgi:hypothetical protein